jgi:hypothetical protein
MGPLIPASILARRGSLSADNADYSRYLDASGSAGTLFGRPLPVLGIEKDHVRQPDLTVQYTCLHSF